MDSPKSFTDSLGREWSVDLTLASAARLKPIAGMTLDDFVPKAGATDAAALHDFLTDIYKQFDIFYALVKPQADALKLTKDQVLEGMGTAEAETSMSLAVIQAIVDFFQRRDPSRAGMVRRAIPMLAKAMTKALSRMEEIDLDKLVDSLLGPSTGDATEEAIALLKKSASASQDTSASATSAH